MPGIGSVTSVFIALINVYPNRETLGNRELLFAQEFLTPVDHTVGERHRYVSLRIRNCSVFDRPDDPRRTVRYFVGVAASHPVVSNLVIRWEITCCERSTEVLFSGKQERIGAENQPESRSKRPRIG